MELYVYKERSHSGPASYVIPGPLLGAPRMIFVANYTS